MNVAEFLSKIVTGWDYAKQTTEIQYVIVIAGMNVLVMIVEKVFGLFAIVISDVKKGK